MQTAIYRLIDHKGNTRYIGKSIEPDKRFRAHLADALAGRCNTWKDRWIRGSIRKGRRIRIKVIMWVDGYGNKEECRIIANYRKRGHALFNISVGGEGSPGVKHSEETRRKMSEAGRGIPASELENAHRIAAMRRSDHCKKISDGLKRAISEGKVFGGSLRKGQKLPEVWVEKVRKAMQGRVITPEHRENIRKALLGRKRTPAECAAISRAMSGKKRKPHSLATIAKMCEGAKRGWITRR